MNSRITDFVESSPWSKPSKITLNSVSPNESISLVKTTQPSLIKLFIIIIQLYQLFLISKPYIIMFLNVFIKKSL